MMSAYEGLGRSGLGICVRAKRSVSFESGEVDVSVKELGPGSYRHRSDEAVDELADCLPSTATHSVEPSCFVIVSRCGRKHGGSVDQSSQLREMAVVSGAGEDLHRDCVADGEVGVEQSVDGVADRRVGVAKKLDPSGGVDDDHWVRLARISARSPSQPEPRNARASSRSSASPTRRLSARLTASRLVASW